MNKQDKNENFRLWFEQMSVHYWTSRKNMGFNIRRKGCLGKLKDLYYKFRKIIMGTEIE